MTNMNTSACLQRTQRMLSACSNSFDGKSALHASAHCVGAARKPRRAMFVHLDLIHTEVIVHVVAVCTASVRAARTRSSSHCSAVSCTLLFTVYPWFNALLLCRQVHCYCHKPVTCSKHAFIRHKLFSASTVQQRPASTTVRTEL
jgi:hypothetical protein